MVLERFTVIIHLYLSYRVQGGFEWLPVLPETSLQIDGFPRGTQLSLHEFLGRPTEGRAFSMVVLHHCELVYPQYRAKTLYVSCLFILNEVPLE